MATNRPASSYARPATGSAPNPVAGEPSPRRGGTDAPGSSPSAGGPSTIAPRPRPFEAAHLAARPRRVRRRRPLERGSPPTGSPPRPEVDISRVIRPRARRVERHLQLLGPCPDLELTDRISLLLWYLKTMYAELAPLAWKDHRKHASVINSVVSYGVRQKSIYRPHVPKF